MAFRAKVAADGSADAAGPAEVRGAARRWSSEPSVREVLALVAVTWLVFVAVTVAFDDFGSRVRAFGDNVPYANAASAIRHWDFGGHRPWHFWGLPYVMALLSLVTGMPLLAALVVISLLSSVAATVLVSRLWGGWTAGFFAVASWEWMQRSFLGGSEPLFEALLLGAFLAARRDRWYLASLLASYATVTRPQGIFALAGLAVALLAQRRVRDLVVVTLIGVAVGGLYVLPHWIYYGDPLANFHFYQTQDWSGRSPVTLPFVAVLDGARSFPLPATAFARSAVWVLIYVAGVVAMVATQRFRRYARAYPAEAVFAALYLWFALSYNSPVWSWVEFARYALAALPIVIYALEPVLPRDRRLLWALAVVSPILAAASALNARKTLETVRALLRRVL